MQIFGDYHSHTKYSDGHGEVIDSVIVAEEAGLKEIGITDHSFTTMFFGLNDKKLIRQHRDIHHIKSDLKILKGIEANVLVTGNIDIPKKWISKFDYINFGFHRFVHHKESGRFLFSNGFYSIDARKKLIESNTAIYIKIIQSGAVDVLVHLNHRCMVDVPAVFNAAKENDVYIEFNEKHIETLDEVIEEGKKIDVKYIIGSDAHYADRVGKFDKVMDFIKRHNIDQERVYGLNGKSPTFKKRV